MRAIAETVRRLLAAEEGFTLSEVLVAAMLGLLIVGTGTMVFTAAVQSQPGQSSRSTSIRDGRTMTERLVRELRQGDALDTNAGDSWNSQTLSFRTYVHRSTCGGASASTARVCRVTYSCSAGSCTRREADPQTGAQGPVVKQISGLASPDVFYPTGAAAACPDPPEPADEGVSITDSATLRNSGPVSPGRICVALVFKGKR